MNQAHPDRKIKVAQILEATVGGTKKHLMYLATKLDKTKFDVSIICSTLRDRAFNNDVENLMIKGVRVKIVQMRRNINPAADLMSFMQIYRYLHKEKFDIVHTHSSKAGFLGRLAAKSAGTPVVLYSPHAFSFQQRGKATINGFFILLERFASLYTDKILAVSNGERKIAIQNRIGDFNKVIAIENGLDLSEFDHNIDAETKKKEFGIDNSFPIVGMVARLTIQKGYQYFLIAAREIMRIIPNVTFVLVGRGEQWREMQILINDLGIANHVIITGHRRDIPDIYALFDVFVLTSLWEGLPYVILEAMAMSKPVIATKIPGIEDIIIEGKTGYLVPPGDVNALSAAIVDLLFNRKKAIDMGREGRKMVEKKYRVETQIRKIELLYENLIRKRKENRISHRFIKVRSKRAVI